MSRKIDIKPILVGEEMTGMTNWKNFRVRNYNMLPEKFLISESNLHYITPKYGGVWNLEASGSGMSGTRRARQMEFSWWSLMNDIVMSSRQCDLLIKIINFNSFRNLRNQIVIKPGPETKVQLLHIGEERDDFFYFLWWLGIQNILQIQVRVVVDGKKPFTIISHGHLKEKFNQKIWEKFVAMSFASTLIAGISEESTR